MEDDDHEEALWTSLNSRLELPADHGRRHHHRSQTSGSLPGDKRRFGVTSPEEKIMNTSRARTPPVGVARGDEYFASSRGMKRDAVVSPTNSVRTANSGSSGSSAGSGGILMKQR